MYLAGPIEILVSNSIEYISSNLYLSFSGTGKTFNSLSNLILLIFLSTPDVADNIASSLEIEANVLISISL